jgi:hypothetical protein
VKKAPCRVQPLANDSLCSVDFCPGCQVFHVKIGYATLHLNPEAFSALCGTVNAALARFQRRARETDQEPAPEARKAESTLH